MLEGFATGSAAMIPTMPAFVPLDDAIRELAAWLPGPFEETVRLAINEGVPMRSRPAPDIRSCWPQVSRLTRRIDVQPGTVWSSRPRIC
jgi:hypothetical protein